MALPGFNADASLYVSSEQYRATAPVGVPTHAVAIAQVGSWFHGCRRCSQSENCCAQCDDGFGHAWSPGPPPRCLLF
jgi:peptide methionine sulfoxide reductase MsrB